jgi:hypothetical protein
VREVGNNVRSDPLPEAPPGTRLAEVTRRAFLRRSAGVIGVASVGGLVGCSGRDDAQVFSSSSSSSSSSTTPTAAASTDGSSSTGTSGAALPASAQLAVTFTYAPTASGGRVNNPYIAAWVEDADSTLVKTLAVWYKQGRDARYLADLTSWSATDDSSSDVSTVSGATRTPGDYRLLWDGTDVDGVRAPLGEYVVAIESAREHGPHSLVRQSITLGDRPFHTALADDGELSGAAVEYRVS